MSDRVEMVQGYKITKDVDGRELAVSLKTGELVETEIITIPRGSKIITPDAEEARKKYFDQQQTNAAKREANSVLGNFFYAHRDKDYNELSPQTLARLIFLATYADYNTNLLVKPNKENKPPIKKNELYSLLKLSQS